jgi:hypothetical protein
MSARRARWSWAIQLALAALTVGLLALPLPGHVPESGRPVPAVDGMPSLPPITITFAANSSAEVNSLIRQDASYIGAGDSFDLVSGMPESRSLDVGELNHWASELRAAFPTARVFAHTAGLSHFTTLAREASSEFSGILYDYEPGYEPEFTLNFTRTLSEFENATAVAHARGLLSVGYPTGQPLSNPHDASYGWNYGALAGTVDVLDVQSQSLCRKGAAAFATGVSTVLSQYAASSASGAPTFQVTLGINASLTPNQVSPTRAYGCTAVLTDAGLRTLYVWWGPGANSQLITFLRDLGRTSSS